MDSQEIRERYQQLLNDYHTNSIDWKAFERGLFELKKMRSSAVYLGEEEPPPYGKQTEQAAMMDSPVPYYPRRGQPYLPVKQGRFAPPPGTAETNVASIYPTPPPDGANRTVAGLNSETTISSVIRASGPLQVQRRNRQLNAGLCLAQRYRLQRQLGIGICGETWRALEIDTGNFVTIKTLPLAVLEDAEAGKAFQYAVQRVAKLRFPGISPVYTQENDDTIGQFLVSAYLDALPLLPYCEQYRRTFREFPMTAVIRVLWSAAKSLDFAHQKGITHRVLKPGNIFAGRQCGIMLTDFFFPQVVQETLLRHGQNLDDSETERYTAPEVYLRQAYSPKSDQFSLAVLAAGLLKSRGAAGFNELLPFQGETGEELRESILTREPVLPEGLSVRAENALRKALAKEPEERFNGCLDFVAELAEFDVPAQGNGASRLRKEGLWAVFGSATLPEPDYIAKSTSADIFPFQYIKSAADPQDGIRPDKASYPYVNPPLAGSRRKSRTSFWKNWVLTGLAAAVVGASAYFVYFEMPALKEKSAGKTGAPAMNTKPEERPLLAETPLKPGDLLQPVKKPIPTPGSDVEPVTPAELTELTQSASRGGIEAVRRLGEVYYYGKGVKTNLDKALDCFKQGSELGDAASLYYLGRYYELGLGGIEKNKKEAISIYKKAEAKGYQPAMEQLRKINP
ncbi:MAG: protein kinase [Planctomycetaceae bacterium]|jgi:serine/threonine protein kinase|nr:protein kinase [Planctomycetaceae bacterium]